MGSQDSYSYYKLWIGGNKMSNDYDYDEEDWMSKKVKFIENVDSILKKSIDSIKRREERLCYGILPNMWSGKRNNS